MMVSETMVTEADVICPATLQQVRDVQRPAVFGDAGAVAGESVPADISRMESVSVIGGGGLSSELDSGELDPDRMVGGVRELLSDFRALF